MLETQLHTASGVVRVTDLMPVLDGPQWRAELQPAREVLRIVECIDGAVELEALFEPRPDYARAAVRLTRRGYGTWTLEHRDEHVLLHSDLALEPAGEDSAGARLALEAGEKRYVSLAYAKSDIAVLPLLGAHAERRRAATLEWWKRWARGCAYRGALLA